MSGSPMPRLITSTPAARLARTLRSSSANMYGGIRSRRLLRRIQLLYEFLGERAPEHRDRPARELDLKFVTDVDPKLAAVEHDRDRRAAPVEDIGHGGPGRPGAAGRGLPLSPLEDPRA